MAVSKRENKNNTLRIVFIVLGALAALLLVWFVYGRSGGTKIDTASWQRP